MLLLFYPYKRGKAGRIVKYILLSIVLLSFGKLIYFIFEISIDKFTEKLKEQHIIE